MAFAVEMAPRRGNPTGRKATMLPKFDLSRALLIAGMGVINLTCANLS
nr:hypothetical protein [uncultured Rhodopila sp.]